MTTGSHFDLIVLGGGAAGLMCAMTAGRRGRRVLVLEGSNRVGKKILMSGGGRCNFTNTHSDASFFLSENPHFAKSALSRYTPRDFIDLVEKHGIPYHEKTLGQLFCDRSSKDIVAMLLEECEAAGVAIRTHCDIETVARSTHGYLVAGGFGECAAAAVVVATGGLSIPKMGASDLGYRIARQFGLNVLDTRAGLVPFTFSGAMQAMTEELAGVSVAAAARAGGRRFEENILFTHRGLSGPAALQVSSYWEPGAAIEICLLPREDLGAVLEAAKHGSPRSRVRTILSSHLPRALVLALEARSWPEVAEKPLIEIGNRVLLGIAAQLQKWVVKPAATEGYRTAEVTLGGVDTAELSSKTMEAKRAPGLYFVGEVVDVTGHLGGFNFQWAWASGYAAGQAV
ncbi:MAG: NAD(P)/FAD-dependent oxidoreductase [Pseudomonadota bacterium]